jgi:hypothetical protein
MTSASYLQRRRARETAHEPIWRAIQSKSDFDDDATDQIVRRFRVRTLSGSSIYREDEDSSSANGTSTRAARTLVYPRLCQSLRISYLLSRR